MKELFLFVTVQGDTFEVINRFLDLKKLEENNFVVVRDYPWRPWPHKDGNLLW